MQERGKGGEEYVECQSHFAAIVFEKRPTAAKWPLGRKVKVDRWLGASGNVKGDRME